jgi:hypothetical protein
MANVPELHGPSLHILFYIESTTVLLLSTQSHAPASLDVFCVAHSFIFDLLSSTQCYLKLFICIYIEYFTSNT